MFEWLKTRLLSDKSRKGFLKDSFIAMSLRLTGILASYIFILLITKNFGTIGLGKYSLTMSFIIFGVLIGKAGFDMALLKYTSENEARNERYLTKKIYLKGAAFCLLISAILTIFILLFAEELSGLLFNNQSMAKFLFYSAFIIILHVFFLIHSEGLRGLKKNNTYLFIQFIGLYLFGCIILYTCLKLNFKDEILPLQIFIISSFICFLISNFLWWKEILPAKNNNEKSFPLKTILKVSFPMFISNTMFVILNWIDTLLLGLYRVEESEIGIYNLSLKVAAIINLPLLAISGILASSISEQYTKGNILQLRKTILDSTRLIFAASVLVYICYLIFPSFFLGLFGKDFTAGSSVLLILSTAFLVSAFSGCTNIILQMTGNERLLQNIMIGATVLNLGLNLSLIPFLGIMGSAISNLASTCFWNFISIYYIKRKLDLNSFFELKLFR